MDDENVIETADDNESILVFRFKTTVANLTRGLLYRRYWPFYRRGIDSVIETIEMWVAKRVSRHFVRRCGMRLVEWANENGYPTHMLMDIISDYE